MKSPEDIKNIMRKHRVTTIDPGMTTAIQHWVAGGMFQSRIHRAGKKPATLGQIILDLTEKMDFEEVDYVIIEGVDFRPTSEVSVASATRGNLSLLAYIVGAIARRALEQGAYVLDPVTYSQWAGQLSYTQLRKILKQKFLIETKNDHQAASIGIGLWAQGEL